MLTQNERQEIEAEFGRYPQKQAVCIEALKIVQRHRGWVPNEGIKDVAELLRMSPHEVDAVATFYNLIYRRPVGRHVIHLCDSVSCWVMGCDMICAHLRSRLGVGLGATTADGRFTLLPIACLGACDHAPVMMINGELYEDLNPEKIDKALEQYE
jgi:NADH-quinone oxidoreductase subunit E